VLAREVEPSYPEAAQAAGIEGTVHLQLTVTETGAVADVSVVGGPDALVDAAVAAVRQYRFEPARLGNEPVAVRVDYRMTFALHHHEGASAAMLLGRVNTALGSPIARARLAVVEIGSTVSTEDDGSFLIDDLAAGRYTLEVSAPGYGRETRSVELEDAQAVTLEIVLWPQATATYETVVSARRGRPEAERLPLALDPTPAVGRHRLTRRDIELTPGSLEDVSRTVQSLPGVVGEPGLLATFYVRGGDAEDVVFYLDGMPIENPFHLGGFASLFNPELIEKIELYAGLQPATYRSSLAGVLDIGYAEGDAQRLEAVADLSMNTAKAQVSGPTGLDGLSFLVTARRSYFEAYFALLREVGVVGRQFAAPDLGEYLAKATYRRPRHIVNVTVLHATDGLSFVGDPDEEALVAFEGELHLRNVLTLASARREWDPSDDVSLRTATVLKAGAGVYTQRSIGVLELDPVYGNPELGAERVVQVVAGVEQALPFGVLARVEAWSRTLTDLVVNPDVASDLQDGPAYSNDGSGWARGADLHLLWRSRIFGAGLSYGYVDSERDNPRHRVFARRYAPLQQQRHTLGVMGDARIGDAWVVSARYQFHSGRPYTPITGFRLAEVDGGSVWVPIVGDPPGDSGRRPLDNVYNRPFHELSIRAEWWRRFALWRMTVYAEVLNVTNSTTTFVPSYDSGDPDQGVLPAESAIETLPIRPFVGVRAEY
jgi:TonB family protein